MILPCKNFNVVKCRSHLIEVQLSNDNSPTRLSGPSINKQTNTQTWGAGDHLFSTTSYSSHTVATIAISRVAFQLTEHNHIPTVNDKTEQAYLSNLHFRSIRTVWVAFATLFWWTYDIWETFNGKYGMSRMFSVERSCWGKQNQIVWNTKQFESMRCWCNTKRITRIVDYQNNHLSLLVVSLLLMNEQTNLENNYKINIAVQKLSHT